MSAVHQSTIFQQQGLVNRQMRQARNGHASGTLWLTGLSGAGKSTLAHAVEKTLFEMDCQVCVLDGDNVRHGLCADLGFSEQDRSENLRRIAEVCLLLNQAGVIVIAAFISPLEKDRSHVRSRMQQENYYEIYCNTPLDVCEKRDVKGLYKRARSGEIAHFTGISAVYEIPKNPDLVVDTSVLTIQESVMKIVTLLKNSGQI